MAQFKFIKKAGDSYLSFVQITVADEAGELHQIKGRIDAPTKAAVAAAVEEIFKQLGWTEEPASQPRGDAGAVKEE